jgi:hypothetical protein
MFLSVCLMFVYPYVCLSVCCLSIHMSACLSVVSLSICLPIHLSAYLSVVCLPVCLLPVCLPVCLLSVCLSICLPACLICLKVSQDACLSINLILIQRYFFYPPPILPLLINAVTGEITLNASQQSTVLDYETSKQHKVVVSLTRRSVAGEP